MESGIARDAKPSNPPGSNAGLGGSAAPVTATNQNLAPERWRNIALGKQRVRGAELGFAGNRRRDYASSASSANVASQCSPM